MPNFGYRNPDNPNYFDPEGMAYAGGNPNFEDPNGYVMPGEDVTYLPGGPEDVPPEFGVPPGGGGTTYLPGTNDPVPGGFNTPGFSISDPSTWGAALSNLPKNILDLMPGSNGNSIAAGLMIPSWLSAYKQWEDSGKYKETAKEAAKYGDPFGQDNRDLYQQKLQASYDDPEAVLNDPGHQAIINNGINKVTRADASKGYLGSGNMATDLAEFVTNENNKFLSDYRKDLQPLTGAQFNPAAAGEFLMKGNQQSIDSQNAALQALMMPFGMNAAENHINNNNGGGQNGGQGKPGTNTNGGGQQPPVDWSKYHTDPASIARQIQSISGGMGGSAMSIINKLLNDPYFELDPSTASLLQSISSDPAAMGDLQGFFPETGSGLGGGYGMFPSPGGASYPAPGYNPFGPSDWEIEDVPNGSVDYGPGLEFETQLPGVNDMVPDWEDSGAWDFSGYEGGYFDP
jgi:hypothetical protein